MYDKKKIDSVPDKKLQIKQQQTSSEKEKKTSGKNASYLKQANKYNQSDVNRKIKRPRGSHKMTG